MKVAFHVCMYLSKEYFCLGRRHIKTKIDVFELQNNLLILFFEEFNLEVISLQHIY